MRFTKEAIVRSQSETEMWNESPVRISKQSQLYEFTNGYIQAEILNVAFDEIKLNAVVTGTNT